jgi:hypothetical protein
MNENSGIVRVVESVAADVTAAIDQEDSLVEVARHL